MKNINTIVLGIFKTPYFKDIAMDEGNCAFPFTEIIGDNICSTIMDYVILAATKTERIIFIIDGLEPNIIGDEDSITCKELITLLNIKGILEKIVWMDNKMVVHRDYIQNKLNLNKELF